MRKREKESRLESEVRTVTIELTENTMIVFEQGEALYNEMERMGVVRSSARIVDPSEANPVEASFLGRTTAISRP